MTEPAHHATRSESAIVLATMPFPANPMDGYTGFERPGTITSTTSIEYRARSPDR